MRGIVSKILQLLLVMFLATFITFGLAYLSPSDAAEMNLTAHGTTPTKELLEQTREEMGLNDPFIVQYGKWMSGVLRGDFGESYHEKLPVAEVMGPKILMTAKLAVAALLVLVVVATTLGITAAVFKGKWPDWLIRGFSLIGISIPEFWLGLLLMYAFVVRFHFFKITDPSDPKSIVLPALTLAIPLTGRYIRLIRATVLEELTSDYVKGGDSRGLKRSRIIIGDVLPNAMKGIITLLGMSIAALLGYTVIVESIFSWPGLGTLVIEAINYRDYPVIQAFVLFMTLIYVGMSFLIDILVGLMDPRVKLKGGANEV